MSAPKVKKSRSKTPPDQPVAGPSKDGKDPPSRRGRKLDFPAKKPLEGKRFYLELTGPRHRQQFSKLKAEVEELGGIVEQFLSKDLACVISDRLEAKDVEKISKGVPSGTSPAVSTPSPFHQGRDTTPGAADSPSNVTKDSRIVTRGKAIVQKATKSQMYGTTDVLTNAKNWNIPIKHLDVLLKYLCREREKLKLSGKDKKSNKEKTGVKAKERQLTKPYLKVEDVSRRFRPISKEFGTWPRILLDTRKGSCPYDPKTRNESNLQGAERTQDRPDASQRTPDFRHRELSRSQSLSKKAVTKAAKQKEATASKNRVAKKGFCEFCSVKYSNLDKHLETEQHKRFVGEKNNYTSLDTMIAQGPNLVSFLEDCVKFQNVDPQTSSAPDNDTAEDSGKEDEVLLLTEPKTPTKGNRKDTKKVKRKTKGATASSRRRSLGRSPRKTVGNENSAEDGPQQNPEETVNNNSITEKTVPQDTSKRRSLGRPADESLVTGGGDTAGVGNIDCPTRGNRNSGLQDRLTGGNGEAMHNQQIGNLTSPEISTGASKFSSPGVSDSRKGKSKKRRSGGRRSLSLQLRENRTVPVTPQSAPEGGGVVQEGVVREAQEACTVLRGIAGQEEPIRQEGEEVVITRIRREDALQEIRVEETDKTVESMQPELCDVVNRESVIGNAQKTVEVTASVEAPDRRRAKRGSQAITSPESKKQSRMRKRQRTSHGEAESDDVFTSNPTTSIIDIHLPLPTDSAMGQDRNSERQKRKSRRSHADAPPQKVRGSSVRVSNNNDVGTVEGHIDTAGSPCIREAQPRVPATYHGDRHSSDDFQTVNTPAPGSAKSSGKKKKKASAHKDLTNTSQDNSTPGPKQKKSSRNQAHTGKSSTAESNNSESDFQIAHPPNSNSKNKKDTSSSAKKCQDTFSKSQQVTHDNGIEATDVEEATCTVLPSGTSQERIGKNLDNQSKGKDQSCPKERVEPTNGDTNPHQDSQRDINNSQAEQSLELVFRSDLGVEESSFLGFSQEEINETANRSEDFQQQNLDKAALSVYCIPSSDPCPDEDRSSNGSNDFTIGLVLQKVDNFPSEGSEWEEQVTGFMKRLDTQLEIKRRRESELSTLPSPNCHNKSIFGWQKENQNILSGVVEDFGPEPLSDDENAQVFPEANENIEIHDTDKRSSTRRRSARISDSFNSRPGTRSTPAESLSYSGMCTSPSKKTKNVSSSKKAMALGDKLVETNAPNALRELSANQLMNSPQKNAETKHYSTPKRIKRNLMNTQQSPSMKHIVLPPGTPVEEQEEIADNYVHDDSESEVIFPKFSSPAQKGSIFSPVKHRVKHKPFRNMHRSVPCLGQRDVQSSPLRPSNRRDLVSFAFPPSSRKSLFMKGRVKRINISSPRKRSKSFSSPPKKSSQFLTFLNELRAGLSPTFYTFKKPHFSLRILQPSAVRRNHCRHKMSRSLLALNLCLPSDAELRIYEFHDDESVDDEEDLVLSPINNGSTRKELHDQCTQTPPSSRKQLRTRSRRLSEGRTKSGSSPNIKGKVRNVKEVEHDSGRKGKRSVKVQASSPEIDSIFDMPPGYYF